MDKEKGKRKLQENSKGKEQITKNHNQVGSLYFGLKNQQEWRMADHNGSTDVSTTPLLGVLDTNHHVSLVCISVMETWASVSNRIFAYLLVCFNDVTEISILAYSTLIEKYAFSNVFFFKAF
jgi:hypothetical protein